MSNAVDLAVEVLLVFVALWPILTAAAWIGGGLVYRLVEERNDPVQPPGGWPGVTLLLPAYNESAVIGAAVRAALQVDYPNLQVMVLDDGSTDDTATAAREAAADDPRVAVVRSSVNRGKADQLNVGMRDAAHDLVMVADADTHLHRDAVKLLVSRMYLHPRVAAVAGMPHVTNRTTVLSGLQILEFSSVVGLIRRTQALAGRVGIVAGVLGLFRRDAVLEVGGYDPAMATEDIELTWRLLLAGWETDFEPHALVGMEVPTTLSSLWAQRRRWSRGQGEALHAHLRSMLRLSRRSLWPVVAEALGSLLWVLGAATALLLALLDVAIGEDPTSLTLALAWGIAIAVVATIQLAVALALQARYDRSGLIMLLLGPIYPIAYWSFNAAAAIRAEVVALLRGARGDRVVWNIPREADTEPAPAGGDG